MSKNVRERYLITGAINNCEAHTPAVEALELMAVHMEAELIVMPIKYNPYHLSDTDIKYAEVLEPYLINKDAEIYDNVLLTTLNTLPTTVRPLSNLAGFEAENNMIIAHPRIHMEHAPTSTSTVKQLMTTGCITKPNYGNSKAGKLATFHHSYGVIVLEVDTKTKETHLRQVSIASDGTICDLDTMTTPTDVNTITADALVFGDVHEIALADGVRSKGMFSKDSLLNLVKPTNVILHDLIDIRDSHHIVNKPFTKYRLSTQGGTTVDEVNRVLAFLGELIETGATPVVIPSNHNNHLVQYLERVSWQSNMHIAKDILKWTTMMLEAIDKEDNADGKDPQLLNLIIEEAFGSKVKTLIPNEKLEISSFICNFHGHAGLNGSRSMINLSDKFTSKLIVGHTHTAQRKNNVLQVGTSSELTRNYTEGLSTWSHTHAIVHPNNKAQLIMQHPVTGNYRITSVTSVGSLIKFRDSVNSSPYFTDDSYADAGYRYKIIDENGEVAGYFHGYRGVGEEVFEGSEWRGRSLIERGNYLGYSVEYLDKEED